MAEAPIKVVEPTISINGHVLNDAQSLTLRVALESLRLQAPEDGVLLERIAEMQRMM